MSTKIYDAFHVVDPATVWEVLWRIEDRAREAVVDALRRHYLELVVDMDPDVPSYREELVRAETDEAIFRLRKAHDLINDGYKKNCTSPLRDTYSLDVTLALYPHKQEFFLRTFCDHASMLGGCLDFVAEMPELRDFHYQNSTDPPGADFGDRVTRRETWDAIMLSSGIGRHVVLEVVCWEGFYRVDPWLELAREWWGAPPELPIREEVWARKLRKLARRIAERCGWDVDRTHRALCELQSLGLIGRGATN